MMLDFVKPQAIKKILSPQKKLNVVFTAIGHYWEQKHDIQKAKSISYVDKVYKHFNSHFSS